MNKQHAVVAIGAGAAAWWLWHRGAIPAGQAPLTATVTTSEGFDLSEYGGPTTYGEPIKRFARAIAQQEGFYVAGSIPQRANNPGDLKAGAPYLPGSSITAFASVDAGWNALYRQLFLILTGNSGYYNLDMTIADMAGVWTATQQGPWAANVAAFLGVPSSTPLYEVLA